jgi:Zn-dependent protease with chaperone function
MLAGGASINRDMCGMRQAQGERVGSLEAPRLFVLLADLQHRMRCAPVAQVVITEDFNASVLQASRCGFIGPRRSSLLLGLPLMRSLKVRQFAAVLAHELAHLVCGHGRHRLSPAHRMRQLWSQPGATFRPAAEHRDTALPLARRNEFEADAMAARLTSPRGTAQALTSVTLFGCYLEHHYWPAVHAAARDPGSHPAPLSRFDPTGIQRVPAGQLRQWRDGAMQRPTGVCDTHPCLGDRLEALGQTAEFAPPSPGEGADRLLGDSLGRVERALDLRWCKRFAPSAQRPRVRAGLG